MQRDLTEPERVEFYRSAITPWTRAVFIATEQGHVVGPSGTSRDLGGPVDLDVLTLLRAMSDVVVVGARTAIVEDYGPIGVRAERSHLRADTTATPALAIITARGELDPSLPMFRDGHRPIVLTSQHGAVTHPDLVHRAEVIVCGDVVVEPSLASSALHERGLRHICFEGGPATLHDWFGADMIDEIDLTISRARGAGHLRFPLWEPRRFTPAGQWSSDGLLFQRHVRTGT